MATPHPARAARLSASIDKAFGEDFVLAARRLASEDVNDVREDDPTRDTFTASGPFDDPTTRVAMEARGHANNHAQNRTASKPSASIADAALPWMPVYGDLLTRVLTGDVYVISRALPDGFGRTTIFLTAKQ